MASNVVKVRLIVDMTDDTTRALINLRRCLMELQEDQPWNDTAAEALENLGEIDLSAKQV